MTNGEVKQSKSLLLFFFPATTFALLMFTSLWPDEQDISINWKTQMFLWNKLCNDSDIKTRWRIVGIDWRTTSVSITNSYLSLQHYKNSERKPLRNNTVAMEFISLCQRDYTAFNKICRHIDFTLRRHRWCIFSL